MRLTERFRKPITHLIESRSRQRKYFVLASFFDGSRCPAQAKLKQCSRDIKLSQRLRHAPANLLNLIHSARPANFASQTFNPLFLRYLLLPLFLVTTVLSGVQFSPSSLWARLSSFSSFVGLPLQLRRFWDLWAPFCRLLPCGRYDHGSSTD